MGGQGRAGKSSVRPTHNGPPDLAKTYIVQRNSDESPVNIKDAIALQV